MAKNSLPSVEDNGVNKPEQLQPGTMVAIEKGESIEPEGYIPRNVDVRMTRAQARILRDKLRKLQDDGATTADGKFVNNRAQAVRWILENETII
jgi:hypothetical protein